MKISENKSSAKRDGRTTRTFRSGKTGADGKSPARRELVKTREMESDGFFASENAYTLTERARILALLVKNKLFNFVKHVFYARERVLCGAVCAVLLIFFALLQTTVFSALRPLGAIPDLMISFVAALAVTEGRKWGAVYGIIAAVVIDALSAPGVVILPLIYMPIGFFCGIICRYYLTGGPAVRAVISFAVLIPRGIVTAVLAVISPLYATAGEIFFEIVIPEAAATLFLAAPVHLVVFLCLRPFHRTRAEMVSGGVG